MQFRLPGLFIGNSNSISWRSHALFAIPAFFSAVFFDYDRFGGRPGIWTLLAIFGYLVTIIAIEILSALFRKRSWRKPRVLLVILILLVAGFVRGASLFFAGTALGAFPDNELFFRLTGGPVFVLASYLLLDGIVSSFRQHQSQLEELTRQIDHLERAKTGFELEISRLNDIQRARVRELVAPSIWELQKLMGKETKNIRDAIFTLKSLNESVVRPLSHEMSLPVGEALETGVLEASERQKSGFMKGLPKRIEISQSVSPGLFLLLTLVLSINSQTAVLGFVPGITLVLFSLVMITGLLIATLFLLRSVVLPMLPAMLVTGFAGLLIGALAGETASVLGLPASELFTVQAAVMISMNLTFTLILGALKTERQNSLIGINDTLEELRLLNSRLRQRVWLARKTLAMELHGSIQSTLQSVAARLSKLAGSSDRELADSLDQVRSAFERVGNEDYLSGKTLTQLLDELLMIWEGALDLQFDLIPEAAKILEQDQAAARCVFEVCREAITNAVKHGEAEQVRVSIQPGFGFVTILVSNDGLEIAGDFAGKGFSLYREVAHSFTLSNSSDGVTLEMQLPIRD